MQCPHATCLICPYQVWSPCRSQPDSLDPCGHLSPVQRVASWLHLRNQASHTDVPTPTPGQPVSSSCVQWLDQWRSVVLKAPSGSPWPLSTRSLQATCSNFRCCTDHCPAFHCPEVASVPVPVPLNAVTLHWSVIQPIHAATTGQCVKAPTVFVQGAFLGSYNGGHLHSLMQWCRK